MSDSIKSALDVVERQVKELDDILAQAKRDLNTAAGKERVGKWKARTVPLLSQCLNPKEAQRFSDTTPGPSFTNDLLEELSDEVEAYRDCLTAMAKELKTQSSSSTG